MAVSPIFLPPGLPADPALLSTLLDLLPMGVIYYTPVVDAAGTLTDLALAYLNPTAQRMTQLPAQPGTTYRQQFPTTDENGAWDFHRRSWLGPEPGKFQFYYDVDGFDSYFRVTAQRLGEGLLVVFTDTRDEVRSQVEVALRESQAREQAARAEAEAQQAELRAVFEQAPVAIALLQGPAHVVEFANARMAQLWGRPLAQVVGQPHFTALPDLAGQGFEAVFDAVLRTGEPRYFQEQAVTINRAEQRHPRYFNITYQPSYNGQGQRTGLIASAIEVTDQVRARQQVEQLNQELETRVQARTQEAQLALGTAERERSLLQAVLTQAPVAISLFQGEEMRITAANAQMAALWGRTPEQVLGHPFMDAVPELRGQGFDEQLRQVLRTQVPVRGLETPAAMLRDGQLQTTYYNFVYQPLYDADGQLLGILDVAVEVTEQVRARQQVEQLNQELETRVRERTQQLEAARAATERERAQLQALLTQAPVAIGLFAGDELRVSAINPLMATLLGYTPAQLLGQPLFEQAPELRGQGFDELMRQVQATQVPFVGQEVAATVQRQGQPVVIYFNFVYQPLYAPEGHVVGIINVAVDVTEQVLARHQAEQLNADLEARVQERTRETLALQAELLAAAQRQVQVRESFYQVFEQTPAAVSLLRGPSYRFEYVNPVYQQVFAGRQLVGRDFAEALPDAAAQGYLALLDGVYQTGETFFGAEVPFVSEQPDAPTHTVYFNFTYQAYRENGEITGISTFALDVTEQVLARQERETQRRELEQLFQQAPTPIVILEGPELVFRLVNPAYQRIFPGRDLLHKPLLVALPELVDTPIPGLFRQVYQTGEPVVVQELLLMMARYEGQALEEIYWTFSYLARRDAHGVIDGVRVFAHDITEQVRTRQAVAASAQQAQALAADLAAANQQLTRTNVDLDTFVYTASHDLKAPITNIESIMLALRETLPADVQQNELVAHLLDLLNQTVARFQFTIGQLTDLSKLQLAHVGPAEPVHLATVVADVRLDLAPLIGAAAALLTVEIAPDLVVSFSPFNLRSIVYNLLSNALKYRAFDRPTQVWVHAEQTDTTVVLTVQDNGLGMSELQQRQLFGLFQRLHTHVEGTGVGLYTTKRLIENAGGSITVASQVDGGTTFTVTFPA